MIPTVNRIKESESNSRSKSNSNSSTTSAFTLPTPSPFNAANSYEEFQQQSPHPPRKSPSLPWLVEYWSSSLLRAPSMLIDQMCACTTTSDTSTLDETYRIDINNKSNQYYFDDILLEASASKDNPITIATPPTSNSKYRKSKNMTDRWDKLRSVVASADTSSSSNSFGSSYDYYEDVLMAASVDDVGYHSARRNSRYPSKTPTKSSKLCTHSYRENLISSVDEEHDKDVDRGFDESNNNDKFDDDDDIRMAPPVSVTPTPSERSIFKKKNENNTKKKQRRDSAYSTSSSNKYIDLNNCRSFDRYIDTTKYLCASSSKSEYVSPPASSSKYSPPHDTRGNTRQGRYSYSSPTYQNKNRRTTSTGPIGGRAHEPRTPSRHPHPSIEEQTQTPPSPTLSTGTADTYTTISLSQSYAKEFDEHDERGEYEHTGKNTDDEKHRNLATIKTASNDNHYSEDKYMFLDRLASESIPISTSTAISSIAPSDRDSDISNSTGNHNPFRGLRQRSTNNISIPEEEEQQEPTIEYGTVNSNGSSKVAPFASNKRTADMPLDTSCSPTASEYRYLIRMRPMNYRHSSSASSGCGIEESKICEYDEASDVLSSANCSSVLLPLHPHKRIIAPLSQSISMNNVNDSFDDSGYLFP